MANASLGVRPQNAGSDSDSDDLFGEKEAKLTKEGKAMRRKLRKYMNDDDGLDGRYMRDSDSVSLCPASALTFRRAAMKVSQRTRSRMTRKRTRLCNRRQKAVVRAQLRLEGSPTALVQAHQAPGRLFLLNGLPARTASAPAAVPAVLWHLGL